MSKTRINTKDNKRHYSDTWVIQDQLQLKQSTAFKVEIEEDTFDGVEKMCEYRSAEIEDIEKNADLMRQMSQDLDQLVNGQQPTIEVVATTLRAAKVHVKKAEETLLEVENSRKCLIS